MTLRRALSAVGLVFLGSEADARTYLGSCFAIVEPTVFVTAAHCVEGHPQDQLWINHPGGPPPNLFTRVLQVIPISGSDLAIVTTDAPEAKWVTPFSAVRYAADFGEKVCAFGFPADEISESAPSKETPRFFRGHVQRPFSYSGGCQTYSAFELSFACPRGLSGGPVFLESDPRVVIGVATANYESFTVLHAEEERISASEVRRLEGREVITFGVAANILAAADALEEVLERPLVVNFKDDAG